VSRVFSTKVKGGAIIADDTLTPEEERENRLGARTLFDHELDRALQRLVDNPYLGRRSSWRPRGTPTPHQRLARDALVDSSDSGDGSRALRAR
jgi:hypothetical protein